MKKTLIVFLIASVFVGCNISQQKSSDSEETKTDVMRTRISVNHEWGTLKNVIIGRLIAENIIIPELTDEMKKEVNYIPKEVIEKLSNYTGKRFAEVFPEFAIPLEKQVERFAEVVSEKGIIVHRNENLPVSAETGDYYYGLQLYTRDPILVIGNKVIITNLKSLWRRVERMALKEVIADIEENFEAEIIYMPELKEGHHPDNVYLEGGDVLLNGYEIYVGNSGHASNNMGIEWLKKALGPDYKVHEIKLREDVLHLDCAMMLLNEHLGVKCNEIILSELPASLENREWVIATPEEAQVMGTNGCIIDSNTIIMDDYHPRIANELRVKNHEVIEIPYDAGKALGGGLRCSHHPLIRESTLK